MSDPDPHAADRDGSWTARRRIPEYLDPTFDGDPDDDDETEPDTIGDDSSDVLQMPGEPSPLDVLRDPEDERLDLPAEEQAMHAIPDE